MAQIDIPPDLNDASGVTKLINLMDEQLAVLHRMDRRQAAADDILTQPIPQVPKTSSSVWGALLQSRISDAIQPQVDRWRSGLDALLVFIGLFSAIVTAFLVDSLSGLQQDEIARTNELISNLTEILVQLSTGASLATFKVASPTHFHPDPVDVRVNSYWTISLSLSLSIAALTIAGRGFLTMTTLSGRSKAVDKLIDINTRWKATETMLGPALEVIPQMIVIPVILFAVGLLDTIFSSVVNLKLLPAALAVASGLSLLFTAGVVAFLLFSLVDGSCRPGSSPFQSPLTRFLCETLKIVKGPIRYSWVTMSSTYHEIVQATHDDQTLDKAAAALQDIVEPDNTVYYHWTSDDLQSTLSHLLAPEAGPRCNHTAARTVVHLHGTLSPGTLNSLLYPLIQAARRSANDRPLVVLWPSMYMKACAVIVGALHEGHPATVSILGSNHSSRPGFTFIVSLLDIIFDYFHSVSPDGSLTAAMVRLFAPRFIDPQHVIGSLGVVYHDRVQKNRAGVIIALLMAAKTPAAVMTAARKNIDLDPLAILPIQLGALVIKSFLDFASEDDSGDSGQLPALSGLFSTCVVVVNQQLTQVQTCRDPTSAWKWSQELQQILETIEPAVACLPYTPELAGLTQLLTECRKWLEPWAERDNAADERGLRVSGANIMDPQHCNGWRSSLAGVLKRWRNPIRP